MHNKSLLYTSEGEVERIPVEGIFDSGVLILGALVDHKQSDKT